MRHTHTHTHRPFRTESLFCAEMGTENDQKSYSTLCWARFHSLCISFDHCCYMSQNVNNVSSPNAGETKHLDGRYNVNSYVMQNDCEKDLEWQREGRKARIVIKWIYIHELIWSIVHEDLKRFNLCDTDSWAAEICWFKWNRYKKQGRRRSFVEMPCKMLMRTTVKLGSIIKQQIN